RVASATLAIGHPRYTSIVRTFTQDESNVEVVLLGRGAIEGQVLNADSGQPIQNFEVKAGSFSPSSYNDGFTTVSDPGGRFRLDDIPVFDQQHLERVTARAEGFAVGSV